MKDPERWLDGASGNTEILRLLKASKDAGPTLAEKAALGARLGVSTTGLWLTPTLKAILASGGIAAAVIAYQVLGPRPQPETTETTETPAASSAQVKQVKPVPQVLPGATLTTEPKQEQAPTAPNTESSEGHASTDASRRSPSQSQSAPGANKTSSPRKLPTEAQLLSQARHALENAPKQALALIQAHEKNYPRGVLTQEREVLKVKALQNLGQTEAAAATEKQFRTEHPESIHHVGNSE